MPKSTRRQFGNECDRNSARHTTVHARGQIVDLVAPLISRCQRAVRLRLHSTDRCASRLSFVDPQSGLCEAGLDQLGLLAKATDRKMEFLMQLLEIPARHVAHLHVLEVVPAALVPGTQVRCVARQRLDAHLAASARHEVDDFGTPMNGRAVSNHQQPRPGDLPQMLKEFDAVQPVQRPPTHQRIDLARRRHPIHDGKVVACLLLADDRRLRLGASVRTKPGNR